MSMKFYAAHKGVFSRIANSSSSVIVVDPKEELKLNTNSGILLPEGVSAHGKKRPVFLRQRLKTKKCHRDLNENSVVASLLKKYDTFDKLAAKEILSITPPCTKGCTDCCHDFFYVSDAEFWCILNFINDHSLNKPEIIAKAEQVMDEIRRDYTDEYEKLQTLMKTRRMNPGQADTMAKFSDRAIERLKSSCPLLKDGECLIYPVRPFICRGYGYLSRYGGCSKCTQLSTVGVPFELTEQNVDWFKFPTTDWLFSRPYPLADFIVSTGLSSTSRYIRATEGTIEQYIVH